MTFIEYAAERGWTYQEEWVEAGQGTDENGETYEWDAFLARDIHKEQPLPDGRYAYHRLTVPDNVADADYPQMWGTIIRLAEAGLARTIQDTT